MMYQRTLTAHFHVCIIWCTHARRTIGVGGVGGAAGVAESGVCNQYAGQRVRMSFAG